jgi:hypothetical protein
MDDEKDVKKLEDTSQSGSNKKTLLSRIHLNEFLAGKNLSAMEKAGFKALCNNKLWMRLHEWEEAFKKYIS